MRICLPSSFFYLTLHVPGGSLRYIAYVIVYKYQFKYKARYRLGEMKGSGIFLVHI